MKWEAITESGADYVVDLEGGFWSHRGLNYDRVMQFAVSKVELPSLPWHCPEDWDFEATEPVIGRRIYVSSLNYWRLSTPVVDWKAWEAEDASQEVGAHA